MKTPYKVDSLGFYRRTLSEPIILYINVDPRKDSITFELTEQQLGHLAILAVQLMDKKTGSW